MVGVLGGFSVVVGVGPGTLNLVGVGTGIFLGIGTVSGVVNGVVNGVCNGVNNGVSCGVTSGITSGVNNVLGAAMLNGLVLSAGLCTLPNPNRLILSKF